MRLENYPSTHDYEPLSIELQAAIPRRFDQELSLLPATSQA
jgi:hypothetical protein